jgi:hypothetical protein
MASYHPLPIWSTCTAPTWSGCTMASRTDIRIDSDITTMELILPEPTETLGWSGVIPLERAENKRDHYHPSDSGFTLQDSVAGKPITFRLAAFNFLGFRMRSSHSTVIRRDAWLYRSYFCSRDK